MSTEPVYSYKDAIPVRPNNFGTSADFSQNPSDSEYTVIIHNQVYRTEVESKPGLKISVSNAPSAQQENNQLQKYVKGIVLGENEDSVFCRLTEREECDIQLPKTIFGDAIFYGMPFILSMMDDNGIRTPIVRRDMDVVTTSDEEKAAWDNLMQEIDSITKDS